MVLLSYEFALFFVLSLTLFAIVLAAGKARPGLRRGLLFWISVLYLWLAGGPFSLLWYGITALAVWRAALSIEKVREERPGRAGSIFRLTLLGLFLLLILFRYVNFPGYTAEEFCWLTGREWEWEPMELWAPLAVSYYTLTLAGYVIDVYRGNTRAEKSCVRFLLFGGFFPQMSVGPIARYSRVAPSLYEDKALTWEDLALGGRRFLWGLFKKLVISERLAVIVNTVYGDMVTYSGLYLVLAALCFTLQLYTDFGGCTDMALGLARIFGVRLEENFRQPFFSRSIAEFWRRWHITLGGWCRDYIYIPLGGSRRGLARHIRNIFLVWMFTGLWHGGKWTFLIGVGLYHAALMSVGLLAKPLTDSFYEKTGLNRDNPLWVAFQRIRTFLLVTAGFVLFRADSLSMAAEIFRGMASGDVSLLGPDGLAALELASPDWWVLLLSLAALAAVSVKKEREAARENQCPERVRDTGKQREEARALVTCFCLLFLVLLFGFYGQGYDASAFIYAQF